MPTYEYTELPFDPFLLDACFSYECGLWNSKDVCHAERPDLISWKTVRLVAKRICTPRQVEVLRLFINGYTQVEIACLIGGDTTRQNVSDIFVRTKRKLIKFFHTYLTNRR